MKMEAPLRAHCGLSPIALACVVALAGAEALSAQSPRLTLDLVVERLMAYTDGYPRALGRIVAEEHYEQRVESPARGSESSHERAALRITLADVGFALLGREWVGIRDVFEVDGMPFPDA